MTSPLLAWIVRYSIRNGSPVCSQRASSASTRSRSSGCRMVFQKFLAG